MDAHSLVWNENMADWKEAGSMPELMQLLNPPQPKPAPKPSGPPPGRMGPPGESLTLEISCLMFAV